MRYESVASRLGDEIAPRAEFDVLIYGGVAIQPVGERIRGGAVRQHEAFLWIHGVELRPFMAWL